MKTVLVTGTTSGIGYSLSELFAQRGYRVILVARNLEKLTEQQNRLRQKNQDIHTIALDLQQPGAAEKLYQQVTGNEWAVDVLVNNAGFNEAGFFTDTQAGQENAMIELHIRFVTEMMKLFIPEMVQRGEGHILNVGSTGSYIACPKDAVYAATKAYILHLSRAVNAELKGTGVSVTTLCPGSTRTEFAQKAAMENTLLFKLFVMQSNKVAQLGYKAMSKRKAVIIPGLYNKILVFSSRLLPYSLIAGMTKKML